MPQLQVTALGIDTRLTLLAAGLVFLWALALGVWKYHGIMTSPNTTPTSTWTSPTGRH